MDPSPQLRRSLDLPGFRLCQFDLPPRYRVPFHAHDQPTLVLQLRGGYTGRGVWRDRELRAGEMLTLPAGERHAEDVAPEPASALLIEATGDRFRRLDVLRKASRFSGAVARAAVQRVQNEFQSGDDVASLALEGLLLELLARLSRQERRPDGSGARWLTQARDILASELDSPVTLADLAKRVGVSRSHLARSFKSAYGRSVGDFLRERRLEKAADLLGSTDRPLAEVALDCGFYDQSHLCRSLRSQLGVTPTELRSGWCPVRA